MLEYWGKQATRAHGFLAYQDQNAASSFLDPDAIRKSITSSARRRMRRLERKHAAETYSTAAGLGNIFHSTGRRRPCQERRVRSGLWSELLYNFEPGLEFGLGSDQGPKPEPKSEPEPDQPPAPSSPDTTPTQSTLGDPQRDERPQESSTLNPAIVALIERVWNLEIISQNRDTAQGSDPNIHSKDDDPLLSEVLDTSDLGQAAEHASLLLDVFSRVKPVDDRQITTVQKRLITTALTSVLGITRQLRVLTVSANEPLESLPMADDADLKVDAGCIVCYERIADRVLMPCRHLTLCEVCI